MGKGGIKSPKIIAELPVPNKMEVTWKPWTDVDYLDFTACNEVCTKKGSKFGGPIVFKMAHCAYM